MDSNIDTGQLDKYRTITYGMAVSFPQPGSAYKFQMEYKDDFGCDLPVREFGYTSVEMFLLDHPMLEAVIVDGKRCFRAKASEKSSAVQMMVKKQKKKKKKKSGAQRGRIFPQRSSFCGGALGTQFMPNVSNRQQYQKVPMGRMPNADYTIPLQLRTPRGTTRPQYPPFLPTSYHPPGGQNLDILGSGRSAPVMPAPPIPRRTILQEPTAGANVELGVKRVLRALEECKGAANAAKFNTFYQRIHQSKFDRDELQCYFGTDNLAEIKKYFEGQMDIISLPNDFIFISSKLANEKKDWSEHNQLVAEAQPDVVFNKPTINTLYSQVVGMLVNMYPANFPVDEISEVYKRAYGVMIDPVDTYGRPWDELINITFKDKLAISGNRVVLSDRAKQLYSDRIASGASKAAAAHKVEENLVTMNDLGLRFEDDEGEEDETGDDESDNESEASQTSNRTLTEGILGTSIFSEKFQPQEVLSSNTIPSSSPRTSSVKPAFQPFQTAPKKFGSLFNRDISPPPMPMLQPNEDISRPAGYYSSQQRPSRFLLPQRPQSTQAVQLQPVEFPSTSNSNVLKSLLEPSTTLAPSKPALQVRVPWHREIQDSSHLIGNQIPLAGKPTPNEEQSIQNNRERGPIPGSLTLNNNVTEDLTSEMEDAIAVEANEEEFLESYEDEIPTFAKLLELLEEIYTEHTNDGASCIESTPFIAERIDSSDISQEEAKEQSVEQKQPKVVPGQFQVKIIGSVRGQNLGL